MPNLDCENCNHANTLLPEGFCNVCHFPIEGSLSNQRTYRNQLSDVKYSLKQLNLLKNSFVRTASYAILFGLPWLVLTVLFTPENMIWIILLSIVIAFFFAISWIVNLMVVRNIWILGFLYALLTIAEFIIIGIPSHFITNQNIGDKTIILFAIINFMGPLLYVALRIGMLTPFVIGILYHKKISKAPENIIHYAITTIRN